MRVALAQINPTVGDIEGNSDIILDALRRTSSERLDVVLFPEMCLLGYPHRDLILRECMLETCERAAAAIAKKGAEIVGDEATIILGGARRSVSGRKTGSNSAWVMRGGRIIATYDKQVFPGYDVFDEDRYYEPGAGNLLFDVNGIRSAVLICEDIWQARDVAGSATVRPRIVRDPVREVAETGCELLFVPSASPFVIGKGARHITQLRSMARIHQISIVLVNQVGANDDLIFDGRSVVIDSKGSVIEQCASFDTDLRIVEISPHAAAKAVAVADRSRIGSQDSFEEETFHALVLGIRDYVRKTRQQRLILGLSGGIDSALTAVLAAAALGAEHVTGVMMPSQYSSHGSITDAEALARNLGIDDLRTIPITPSHEALRGTFPPSPQAGEGGGHGSAGLTGVTDENVQARLRCIILMAVSNDMPGSLVLATGNKSELAMGYCTLYGDMAGALAPLGDLLKTQVYELATWINAHHRACGFAIPPIPEASITKPPSAELRPNQTDQDTLPPYEILDAVVQRYIDQEESIATITQETEFDAALVKRITRTIDINEYKRRQAAIVLKVNPRTFGPGRPMPVAMRM